MPSGNHLALYSGGSSSDYIQFRSPNSSSARSGGFGHTSTGVLYWEGVNRSIELKAGSVGYPQFTVNNGQPKVTVKTTLAVDTNAGVRDSSFNSLGDSMVSLISGNNFGVGINGAIAKLHVKSSGSTSATTAFLVRNSLNTDLLKVNDAGECFLKVQPNSNTDEVEDIFRNTLTGELEASLLKIKQETINSIDRITWKGTTGSLFSIIDDKDNELWTASDISGNPIGYIDADWNVRFGNPFNRPFSIRHDSTTGIDYTKFVLPDYANDSAADADTALLSGESYTTSAVDRNIKIKP
jgi:hypothetical protein